MVRATVLLVACVFAAGCFVFDELDSGKKIMEQNSPTKPPAAPAQKPAAPQAGADWWAKAKSLSGPPADDGKNPVVACTVGKSTGFMHKIDCQAQGGHPAS